jgi:hypothetical protein
MGLLKLLTDPGNFLFYTENQKGPPNPNNLNPREIPFGSDRFGGGSSKQPYITKNVSFTNDDPKSPAFYNDFVLRGGILAAVAAGEDVSRLTKYFTDLDNPVGALFATKQNILSRTGTKTEASYGSAYLGSAINEGVYTPLSALTQAGIGFLGSHINKQGLDPTGAFPGANIRTYQETITEKINTWGLNNYISDRLTNLQELILNPPSTPFSAYGSVTGYSMAPDESTLMRYTGGPGSVLGVGSTSIGFATTNTGVPLKTLTNNAQSNTPKNPFRTWGAELILNPPTGSTDSLSLIRKDFRQELDPTGGPQNRFLSLAPNYTTKNVERRIGLNNPGRRDKNRSNYDAQQPALDRVNASYIYKNAVDANSNYGKDPELNDILPFYIAILNNDLQNGGPFKKYMHFRAFIDSFSDNYNADWNAINYMGRAEKFYKYKGFDRTINMSFTVVAQSKQEITAMYDKLNFLASSLAPEYLDSVTSGYMAGNIAYLTLGGYVHEQPGIITSLTYDIPEESPWEIGIDVNGNPADPKSVRQLPHIIRVTGFQFTPIHTFRPEKQSFKNDELGTNSERLLEPGNQKFIDQLRPNVTNYDEEGRNSTANTNAGSTNISLNTLQQNNEIPYA